MSESRSSRSILLTKRQLENFVLLSVCKPRHVCSSKIPRIGGTRAICERKIGARQPAIVLAQISLLLSWKGTRLPLENPFLVNDVRQLGLSDLENTALGDVTAKTSVTNVVRETFSKSTAR